MRDNAFGRFASQMGFGGVPHIPDISGIRQGLELDMDASPDSVNIQVVRTLCTTLCRPKSKCEHVCSYIHHIVDGLEAVLSLWFEGQLAYIGVVSEEAGLGNQA